MTYTHEREGNSETLEITPATGPIAITLATLCVLAVGAIAFVLLTRSVPLPLIALLLTAAAMLLQLTLAASQSLWPIRLLLDDAGLTIKLLLGTTKYPWSDVAAIKLVHSGGTLADDPRSDTDDRLAVGLFLKSSQAGKGTDPEPDVLICTAHRSQASELMKIAEHANAFVRRLSARTIEKARIAQGPGAASDFKRRPRPIEPAAGTAHYIKPGRSGFGRRGR
jgi:hypothetical protein